MGCYCMMKKSMILLVVIVSVLLVGCSQKVDNSDSTEIVDDGEAVIDCGVSLFLEGNGTLPDASSDDPGLSCLGENLKNDCSSARLFVNDEDIPLFFSVMTGEDDVCTLGVHFPESDVPDDSKPYAGSEFFCDFPKDQLLSAIDGRLPGEASREMFMGMMLVLLDPPAQCYGPLIDHYRELTV